MGEVATIEHPPRITAMAQTATEMRSHVQRIQQVMKAVMKPNVHYGKIPGAGDKSSLFKPGAEVLCAAFHIAPTYRVEDLSDHDCVRYRVTCIGTHQTSGVVLGEGLGEASSNEEKYKWRSAVCKEEFEEWDASRKRVKWSKGGGGSAYQRQQVRTEPADIANTVLKMACKRAQVAMTINVTAASDIFTQDLEDGPPGGVDPETGECDAPPPAAPKRPQPTSSGGSRCTQKQANLLLKRLDDAGVGAKEFCEHFAVGQVVDLPFEKVDEALRWIAEHNAEPGARG